MLKERVLQKKCSKSKERKFGSWAHLGGAVDGAVHGGDGGEVDNLHLALEVGVAHDLARRSGMHAQHLAVAQVQHIAAIQLRTCTSKYQE